MRDRELYGGGGSEVMEVKGDVTVTVTVMEVAKR